MTARAPCADLPHPVSQSKAISPMHVRICIDDSRLHATVDFATSACRRVSQTFNKRAVKDLRAAQMRCRVAAVSFSFGARGPTQLQPVVVRRHFAHTVQSLFNA
jgi:hypothetical protein